MVYRVIIEAISVVAVARLENSVRRNLPRHQEGTDGEGVNDVVVVIRIG